MYMQMPSIYHSTFVCNKDFMEIIMCMKQPIGLSYSHDGTLYYNTQRLFSEHKTIDLVATSFELQISDQRTKVV